MKHAYCTVTPTTNWCLELSANKMWWWYLQNTTKWWLAYCKDCIIQWQNQTNCNLLHSTTVRGTNITFTHRMWHVQWQCKSTVWRLGGRWVLCTATWWTVHTAQAWLARQWWWQYWWTRWSLHNTDVTFKYYFIIIIIIPPYGGILSLLFLCFFFFRLSWFSPPGLY